MQLVPEQYKQSLILCFVIAFNIVSDQISS